MNDYTLTRFVLFQVYRAVPFLFELKTILDWTVTRTALSLFQWIKFEDIYAKLYAAKCTSIDFQNRLYGEKVKFVVKFFLGGCGLVLILLFIFGPMLLFSSLNPIAQSNLVTGASIEVGLKINQTNYFKLFENSHVINIHTVDDNEFRKYGFENSAVFQTIDRGSFQVKLQPE